MCRRNHLMGWMLITFGLGLLIGFCSEGGFFSCCLAVGAVIAGFLVAVKN